VGRNIGRSALFLIRQRPRGHGERAGTLANWTVRAFAIDNGAARDPNQRAGACSNRVLLNITRSTVLHAAGKRTPGINA
jgi:hypothetical protein